MGEAGEPERELGKIDRSSFHFPKANTQKCVDPAQQSIPVPDHYYREHRQREEEFLGFLSRKNIYGHAAGSAGPVTCAGVISRRPSACAGFSTSRCVSSAASKVTDIATVTSITSEETLSGGRTPVK